MTDKYAVWKDRRTGVPCINKRTTDITGKQVIQRGDMKTSDLMQYKVDILGGHVSIGIDKFWFNDIDRKEPIDAQYFAFFCEPLHRYVSALLFQNKASGWNEDKAYEEIKNRVVTENRLHRHVNNYTLYLLTPIQKETEMSDIEKVALIKENVISFKVLVGIVEYMDESLSLLQSVLDPTLRRTSIFLSRIEKKANKSKLSSSELVKRLSKDKAWLQIARQYLKYEYELYNFAVNVHKNQYNAMLSVHGEKYINRV